MTKWKDKKNYTWWTNWIRCVFTTNVFLLYILLYTPTMKKTWLYILLVIIISLLTVIAITYFGIPFINPVSEWDITKIVKQQIVEEKINETSRIMNLESNVTMALDKIAPSVVTISLQDSFPNSNNILKKWGASGIIITKDGYILTNKHAVSSQEEWIYVVKTNEGARYPVDTIREDPIFDIALLHISNATGAGPSDLAPASFVSYKSTTRIGQFVVSLWNIENQDEASATLGIISATNRTLTNPPTSDMYVGLYQTDASLQEWNSGWPLLNVAWDVIWVATAKSPASENIWYAIPITSEYINATIASIGNSLALQNSGEISNQSLRYSIPRPYIGWVFSNLTKELAKINNYSKYEWYLVKNLDLWTPSAIAGLLSWDIITEINWVSVNNTLPFEYALFTFKPGEKISLRVFRGKEYKTIEVSSMLYKPTK